MKVLMVKLHCATTLLLFIIGCSEEPAPAPAEPSAFFQDTAIRVSPNGWDSPTVAAGADLRASSRAPGWLMLEMKPGRDLPDEFSGRPVSAPEHWTLACIVRRLNDTTSDPVQWIPFNRYQKSGGPASTPPGFPVPEAAYLPARPKTMDPASLYYAARIGGPSLSAGVYQYEIVAYPSPDPGPEAGVMPFRRSLGPPVIVQSGSLTVTDMELTPDES